MHNTWEVPRWIWKRKAAMADLAPKWWQYAKRSLWPKQCGININSSVEQNRESRIISH